VTANGFTYAFLKIFNPTKPSIIVTAASANNTNEFALGDLVTNSVAIVLNGERKCHENNSSSPNTNHSWIL
jgi:hypothetical protein